MKKILCYLVLLLYNITLGQKEIINPVNDEGNNDVLLVVNNLKYGLRNNNINLLKSVFLNNFTVIESIDSSEYDKNFINKLEKFFETENLLSNIRLNIYVRDYELTSINENKSFVKCNFLFCNEYFSFEKVVLIELAKKNSNWFIKETGHIVELMSLLLKNYKLTDNKYFKSTPTVQIKKSNNTLIQVKQSSEPLIWEINKSITTNFLQRNLFANGSEIDMELFWYGNNWPVDVVVFALDPIWGRIIFAKNSGEIKSYGDNANDFKFSNPLALTIDEFGNIYIANTRGGNIIKLKYNPNNNTISYVNTLNIPTLIDPTDISFSRSHTNYNDSDDLLWIVDRAGNKILVTDINGNIINSYNSYYKSDLTIYNFESPLRLAVDKNAYIYSNIGLIETGRNSIIHGAWLGTPSKIYASTITKFSNNSYLTDIGLNCNEEYVVTDFLLNMIHKLDQYGNYLCSFDYSSYRPQSFLEPVRVSNIASNKPGWLILNQFIADNWSQNFGIKEYVPGADVLNLTYVYLGSTYFKFTFTLTDFSEMKIEIINSNNAIVKSYGTSYQFGGLVEKNISSNEFPLGNYRYRVSVKPRKNSNYGSHAKDWLIKEISFSTIMQPIISGFTQSPSIIYRGNSGTVTAHLSQGNGNITYSWSHSNLPSGASVTYNGNRANIYYGYSKLDSVDYDKVPAPTLTCTATNAVGSSTSTTVVYFSSGSSGVGCPFVYTWNGNEFIEDNNILPQSVYTPPEEGLVTDYYQLFTEPVETDRTYKLRVGEFEQEISTLDQFKLLIVDHIPEALVSANDNGEISLYAKPASLTNANVDDGDVYKLVYEMDDNYVETEPDQSMQLTFEDGQVGSDKVMLLVGSSPIKIAPIGALEKLNGKNIDPQDIRFRKNMSYTWVPVNVQNHKETNIDIGINWTGTAKLDYSELSNKLNLDYTLHESELISAEHSQTGDVTSSLQISDGNIVELNPQEWVDLVFTAPPLSAGMKRSFIFVSRGRYVTIPEEKQETLTLAQKGGLNESVRSEKLPVSYQLFDNHPNPFNPVTRISYTLPEPNFVSLKIFDVLGREITTLVAEYQDAGYKTVEFSGVSTNGGLPSGVYFYKLVVSSTEPLQAGSPSTSSGQRFISVKKMLLAK